MRLIYGFSSATGSELPTFWRRRRPVRVDVQADDKRRGRSRAQRNQVIPPSRVETLVRRRRLARRGRTNAVVKYIVARPAAERSTFLGNVFLASQSETLTQSECGFLRPAPQGTLAADLKS
jgi:hypothetical protein